MTNLISLLVLSGGLEPLGTDPRSLRYPLEVRKNYVVGYQFQSILKLRTIKEFKYLIKRIINV